MRRSVACRSRPTDFLEPIEIHQARLSLVFDVEADPVLDLSVARLLLVVMEELRSDGVVVHRVRTDLAEAGRVEGWEERCPGR